MSYLKYEHDIITKYKVELLGWPITIKFTSPSEIGTIDEIRRLRQAFKDCKWVVQTRRQQQAHLEMLAARAVAGEPVVKKRKQRLDKGKTRKKKTAGGILGRLELGESSGEEHTQPPKKKRKIANATAARKLPPAAKSWPFIHDTSDDSFDNA
jgi:hypothetical protein